MSARRPTLAVVANEFFAPELGRMGGFGWAAREASRVVGELLDSRLELVFISCEHRADQGWPETVHSRRLITAAGDPPDWPSALEGERIDAFLTIDFRPSYELLLRARPGVPLLVWVRDPRAPQDLRVLETLRVPGSTARPQGIGVVDCTGLARVARTRHRLRRRRVIFASVAPDLLTPKAPPTYGLDTGVLELLPNPIPAPPPPDRSRPPKGVSYLGRLDPIKRPWVTVEVARRIPEVEFHMLGRAHFDGDGSWQPDGLPPNVIMHGHTAGRERDAVMRSSSLLINTSISEGLPVSFLEALAYELPVISLLDPERVASRFGSHVGAVEGDGLEAVPDLERAIRHQFEAHDRRISLGRAGGEWMRAVHSPQHFADRLTELLGRLGLRLSRPSSSAAAAPRTR